MELATLERLKKKSHILIMGVNLISTLAPSLLIESSSFLGLTRTTIKAWISSKFGRIPLLTLELAALERLKKNV